MAAGLAHRPAPAGATLALRQLFDDSWPRSVHATVGAALEEVVDCGRAPNHTALRALRRALEELKAALAESDEIARTRVCASAFDSAEHALTIDPGKPAATQMLLSHLETTLASYRICSDTLRMDRTPELYVALTRYLEVLDDRHPDEPGAGHEAVRAQLFEPQRQRIVREYASGAGARPGQGFDVFDHLGITPDYRATDQDRADFRALFESGQILRQRMVYTEPETCRALYRQYEREVGAAMMQDAAEGANLHDLIAVRTYTVSSNELNQALRERDLERIARFAPYIKTFISGHALLRPTTNSIRPGKDGFITLKRAVEMSEADILRAGYVAGATFCQPTPMSCTDDPQASFWRLRNKYNVHLHVRCKSAREVGGISRHAHSEAESILAPRTWFRVTDATWLRGGTRSHPWLDLVVEEIDAPPSTRNVDSARP